MFFSKLQTLLAEPSRAGDLAFGLPGELVLDLGLVWVVDLFDLAEPSLFLSGDFVPFGDFGFGDLGFFDLSNSTCLSCSSFHAFNELCPTNLSVMYSSSTKGAWFF